MDGWDSWKQPPTHTDQLLSQYEEATHEREIVWDRGMPQESRERITRSDPRWHEAESVRDPMWMGFYEDEEDE